MIGLFNIDDAQSMPSSVREHSVACTVQLSIGLRPYRDCPPPPPTTTGASRWKGGGELDSGDIFTQNTGFGWICQNFWMDYPPFPGFGVVQPFHPSTQAPSLGGQRALLYALRWVAFFIRILFTAVICL